jgi:hypothetical protein
MGVFLRILNFPLEQVILFLLGVSRFVLNAALGTIFLINVSLIEYREVKLI